MTIVDPVEQATANYQRPIPGNTSPKMELYNSISMGQSPVFNGFRYNDIATSLAGTNGIKSITGNGPDQCAPAEHIWSTEPGTPVKIRMGRNPQTDGTAPESVPTWFQRIAGENSSKPALKVKREGRWKTWTYREYLEDVKTAAKAFIYLGLEPYHAVGIIGFNSPEWFISDIAAIYAGYEM
jgi:hypothetical protein